MDERNLTGRAPWWFRKLVDAETAEYARLRKEDPMYGRAYTNARHDGGDPPYPMFDGDELTLAQKLAKYNIVKEDGDEWKSARLAAAKIPSLPVPKLGSFIRDPEADAEFGS